LGFLNCLTARLKNLRIGTFPGTVVLDNTEIQIRRRESISACSSICVRLIVSIANRVADAILESEAIAGTHAGDAVLHGTVANLPLGVRVPKGILNF